MFYFDPVFMLATLLGVAVTAWAQWRVTSKFKQFENVGVRSGMTGAEAAAAVCRAGGATGITIEATRGRLTDHYDPRAKVLRLSQDVYDSRSLAAVGIAAHEAGHALQDAKQYALMGVRNAAVGAANFGSGLGLLVFMIGLGMALKPVAWLGIILFAGTVFFQLVNLPVEIDASNRAKAELVTLGIVPAADMPAVNSVLNAAAWTYVAATLQSALTLLYYASYLTGSSDDR